MLDDIAAYIGAFHRQFFANLEELPTAAVSGGVLRRGAYHDEVGYRHHAVFLHVRIRDRHYASCGEISHLSAAVNAKISRTERAGGVPR